MIVTMDSQFWFENYKYNNHNIYNI